MKKVETALIDTRPSAILAGVAGEYYVAAELSSKGYIASITLRNSKGVDVLCSNADATRSVGIQVKTSFGQDRRWLLNKEAEDYYAENLFYVFVCLNKNQSKPEYFVVPSKHIAKQTKEGHAKWLLTPGKKGRIHKDSKMRIFKDKKEEFKDRWDLLGL